MHNTRGASSSQRWYQGAPPRPTGMFFGAIGGVGFVLPFIAATFLQPRLGDGWTISILSALIGISVLLAARLFVRGRWVEGLIAAPLVVGLSLSIWITATMRW